MKNDYKRNDFWEKKINSNKIEYYLKIKNEFIQVEKEVFYVLKNSYRSILREQELDYMYINSYCDIDNAVDSFETDYGFDVLSFRNNEYIISDLLTNLTSQERYIIYAIYYDDKTEREISKELNITKSSLHRRKVSALKKIKKNLLKPNQSGN